MRKIALAAIIVMLSGCHLIDSNNQPPITRSGQTPGTVVTPPDEPDPGTVIVTPPAKTVDWPVSLEKTAEKVVKDAALSKDDLLLIDNVKNNSNASVNTADLNERLKQIIESTKRFNLVPGAQLAAAKTELGLSNEDSLNTRSKTIGLARHLNASHILFTTIDGKDIDLTLSSQIMQVNSGELIWSAKTPVQAN
jgi:uncharacterized protein (TIGR02722 family)